MSNFDWFPVDVMLSAVTFKHFRGETNVSSKIMAKITTTIIEVEILAK